jgi:UDP-N-acetylglucosamine 2-epimerase (hydrolysing)
MDDMNRRRIVLFLTGTRADFGKMKPLITEVDKLPRFESHIFATGMHLLSLYGSTINEVKMVFQNIFPHFNQTAANRYQMDLVLANTIQGLGLYVRELKPDLIVVHGDRIEALAGAIVGALNNILVAHIEGGELSGTVDELIRHAISKLSHLHFVSNEDAKQRLIQMGENDSNIFVIGSPDVDIMISNSLPSINEALKRYEIPFEEYLIFMYHPVTTELSVLREHINSILEALVESQKKYVAIYPNNDSGSEMIIESIDKLNGNNNFKIFPSIRFEYFLTLLKHATAIIGNSSAGIREAPVYGLPTIDIGSRQRNRFQWPTIMNVPVDRVEILDAINNLPKKAQATFNFGNGNSAVAFANILKQEQFWQTSSQKQFHDIPSESIFQKLLVGQ